MNKGELVSAVAQEVGLTKADAERAINATLGAITKSLHAGEKVSLVGFGSFETRNRKERTARNPQTGESILVAERRVPTFKASKVLKDTVASAL